MADPGLNTIKSRNHWSGQTGLATVSGIGFEMDRESFRTLELTKSTMAYNVRYIKIVYNFEMHSGVMAFKMSSKS